MVPFVEYFARIKNEVFLFTFGVRFSVCDLTRNSKYCSFLQNASDVEKVPRMHFVGSAKLTSYCCDDTRSLSKFSA